MSLKLPKDYKLPKVLNNLDEETWCKLIDYMANIYISIKNNLSDEEKDNLSNSVKLKLSEQNDTISSLQQELDKTKDNLSNVIKNKDIYYNNQLNDLNQIIISLRQSTNDTVIKAESQLRAKYENKLAAAESKIASYQDKLSSIKQEKYEEISKIRSKLDDNYQVKMDKLEDKISNLRQELFESKTNNNKLESTKIIELMDKNSTLQAKIEEMFNKINELKISKIQLESNIKSELTNKYQKEINELNTNNKEKLNNLADKYQSIVDRIKEEQKNKLLELNKEQKNKLLELNREQENKLLELTKKQENKLLELNKKQENKLLELTKKQENKLLELNKEYSINMKEQKSNYEALINETIKNNFNRIDQNISTSLEPIKLFAKGDNMEKGDSGEYLIKNLLIKYFRKAKILDTSSETSKGDMWLIMNSLRCLIEVKNKNQITKEDITKFIKDVQFNSEITCGLFISLKTSNILDKRDYIYQEFVGNKPVVYIYLEYEILIQYAIALLETICKMYSKIDAKQNQQQQIVKMIGINYRTFINSINDLSHMNRSLVLLSNRVIKTKSYLIDQLDIMSKFYNDNPTYKDASIELINEKDIDSIKTNGNKNLKIEKSKEETTEEVKYHEHTPEELQLMMKYIVDNKIISPSREDICKALKVSQLTYKIRKLVSVIKFIKINYDLPKYTDEEMEKIKTFVTNNNRKPNGYSDLCKLLNYTQSSIKRRGGISRIMSEYKQYIKFNNRWEHIFILNSKENSTENSKENSKENTTEETDEDFSDSDTADEDLTD
jgi:hypothetical protein